MLLGARRVVVHGSQQRHQHPQAVLGHFLAAQQQDALRGLHSATDALQYAPREQPFSDLSWIEARVDLMAQTLERGHRATQRQRERARLLIQIQRIGVPPRQHVRDLRRIHVLGLRDARRARRSAAVREQAGQRFDRQITARDHLRELLDGRADHRRRCRGALATAHGRRRREARRVGVESTCANRLNVTRVRGTSRLAASALRSSHSSS